MICDTPWTTGRSGPRWRGRRKSLLSRAFLKRLPGTKRTTGGGNPSRNDWQGKARDSGAGHEDVRQVASTLKDQVSQLSSSTLKSGDASDPLSKALVEVLNRLEDNSRRLESIAEIQSKKIDLLAEKLISPKDKRKKEENAEVKKYASVLKKKKTDEGEDIIAFD